MVVVAVGKVEQVLRLLSPLLHVCKPYASRTLPMRGIPDCTLKGVSRTKSWRAL